MKSTKLPKKLLWIRPYLELSRPLLPSRKRLSRVGLWTIHKRYGKGVQAAIYSSDQREYRVYLHTLYHPRGEKTPLPLSKIDMIKNLAHELAHMADMEHSPQHTKLEARLLLAFMERLRFEGYISEEEEFRV